MGYRYNRYVAKWTFVKTEGTFTQFEDINIVGVGGSNSLVEGNPDVVTGTVAIGFKF